MSLSYKILCSRIWGFLLLAACTQRDPAASSSTVGEVQKGDLIQKVNVTGIVTPNRKAVVTAPYNAYIKKLYVKLGEKVQANQPILSLSQSLRGNEEENFPLRSPFTGYVVQMLKSEGEYVEVGASNGILRIDDLSHLFIEANVPEVDVVKLKVGQETKIRNASGDSRSYRGMIKHISLAALESKDWNRSRVEFPVKIEILDPDEKLKPGMSTLVEVVTQERKDVLFVRHEFIERDGDSTFIIDAQGARKAVRLGLQNEEAAVVIDGVRAGEKIKQIDFLKMSPET